MIPVFWQAAGKAGAAPYDSWPHSVGNRPDAGRFGADVPFVPRSSIMQIAGEPSLPDDSEA
jgi:hypothetical protein